MLLPGISGRYEKEVIKLQGIDNRMGNSDMAVLRWVKSPAKDAYASKLTAFGH
jgi:hypothetical protein